MTMVGDGDRGKRVWREVISSLPGRHKRTIQLPPDDTQDETFVRIMTGGSTERKLLSIWHSILGLTLWVLWIGWAVYMWFFSSAGLDDLVIAIAVFLATYIFTIIGVPLVRLMARNRAS